MNVELEFFGKSVKNNQELPPLAPMAMHPMVPMVHPIAIGAIGDQWFNLDDFNGAIQWRCVGQNTQ